MEKLSFVIPCYGSETTIEIVVNEIRDTLRQRPEYDYEIILVNDCSPDNVFLPDPGSGPLRSPYYRH